MLAVRNHHPQATVNTELRSSCGIRIHSEGQFEIHILVTDGASAPYLLDGHGYAEVESTHEILLDLARGLQLWVKLRDGQLYELTCQVGLREGDGERP